MPVEVTLIAKLGVGMGNQMCVAAGGSGRVCHRSSPQCTRVQRCASSDSFGTTLACCCSYMDTAARQLAHISYEDAWGEESAVLGSTHIDDDPAKPDDVTALCVLCRPRAGAA